MEAAHPEESEPPARRYTPAGTLTLNIRTLTGGTTTLRDVVWSACKSSIDPRKPGDKKTVRYASSMRWRANPATG